VSYSSILNKGPKLASRVIYVTQKKWSSDCDLAALDGPSQRLRHQKSGCWIAIWRLWIHLGTVLLHSIVVGHAAGFLCREGTSKLRAASTLPDKDAGSGHTRFLGWAIADRATELTPSSLLPSSMVAFRFPALFSLSWQRRLCCLRKWSPSASLPLSLRLPISSNEPFLRIGSTIALNPCAGQSLHSGSVSYS
jgi:hypothetical protein